MPNQAFALIEAEWLASQFGDSAALQEQMCAMFQTERKKSIDGLEKLLLARDLAGAAELAHSLAGVAAILGMRRLQAFALEFELQLQSSQEAACARQLEELTMLCDESESALRRHLATLK